jgi:hypothetical protein
MEGETTDSSDLAPLKKAEDARHYSSASLARKERVMLAAEVFEN